MTLTNVDLKSTFLTSAFWLSLLPAFSHAQDNNIDLGSDPNTQARIFLNAGHLTAIQPLLLNFHADQITLEEQNEKSLQEWTEKLKEYAIPIHIYSYATLPHGRRDLNEKSAHHIAVRKAFNRALLARTSLQNKGIPTNLITVHAIGPEEENSLDQLHITIRSN